MLLVNDLLVSVQIRIVSVSHITATANHFCGKSRQSSGFSLQSGLGVHFYFLETELTTSLHTIVYPHME
jgi:hypothetical protein